MPIILEEKQTGGQEKSNLHLSILLSTNVSSVPKQNQELKNCLLYNLNSKIMLNTQHNPDTQITKFISQLTQHFNICHFFFQPSFPFFFFFLLIDFISILNDHHMGFMFIIFHVE